MDQMRVHDVRALAACNVLPSRTSEHRVDVAWRREPVDTGRREVQLGIERIRVVVVETDEVGVDTALAERRQECQQVSLGAADAAHAVDVDDLHAPSSRLRGRCRAVASRPLRRRRGMQRRKFHGAL